MLGRFLFRWRGFIGFLAFGVVFWFARPTSGSCLLGLPLVLVGLGTRFWASGYIGIEGRAREIGASRRIVGGPYRFLRHPLYIGNFMLVAGMLVVLQSALWLAFVVLAGFVVEYGLIVAAEERDLAERRTVRQGPPGPSQKLEARVQNAEFQMAVSGGREAEGESFSARRALCEWRTWVVTGVALGLALFKALVMG
jgi:hypothetical protein